MALMLHDTLSGEKRPFRTIERGKAQIYVCGPTVYDYAHVGHARCYVTYDVFIRHLRESGLQVNYVRNITDVEDKIVKRAAENGETPAELSTRVAGFYREDFDRLGNLVPDVEPKVSDHIPEIRALIGKLIERGAAYASQGDVYFRVSAYPGYGKLSHRKIADLEFGASGRTVGEEDARKEHPADFALWKGAETHEQGWPSPWGFGRPGWHIECSAMAMRYLGETFDLHAGGLDLVFPHHENEIAQSEAATGKPYCNHWMHNGFIEANKEKMSKSLGNFFTAREVFLHAEPEAMRYFALSVHYRSPLNFDWTIDDAGKVIGFPQVEDAERRVEYIYNTRVRLSTIPQERVIDIASEIAPEITELRTRLLAALDDDFNVPVALGVAYDFLKAANELADRASRKKGTVYRGAIRAAETGFSHLARILGLGAHDPVAFLARIRARRIAKKGLTEADVDAKIAGRIAARQAKDFAKADAIRDELLAIGVELMDGNAETTWRVA